MPIDSSGASIADWISGGWNGCPRGGMKREGKTGKGLILFGRSAGIGGR
jgi:hypothetical protein